ncbi:MAG TPA: carboxypeptidase regulatory-like domain-containing protein [Gemmatimonadaceae bacterium]|nr:carboxypeptidase regulatory-like domain-containing protein [Gemmatimonadaceae bacterium]
MRPAVRAAVVAMAVATALGVASPAGAQQPGTVRGIVYDSVAAAPMVGSTVQMVLRADPLSLVETTSDSLGRFEFRGLASGDYIIGFQDRTLEAYGIVSAPVRALRLGPGEDVAVTLAVPSGATLARAHCGASAPNDSSGALLGRVSDADSGTPLPGARVHLSWFELVVDQRGLREERRTLSAEADVFGFYRICGVPTDGEVVAETALASRHSGALELLVPPRGATRQDFTLGDSLSAVVSDSGSAPATGPRLLRGRARVAGQVRDARGRALEGAFVTVPGTGVGARSGIDGAFVLGGLPAGTYALEARMIGMTPAVTPVHLSTERTSTVAVVLTKQPPQLSKVTVYGKSQRTLRDRDLERFLRRKQSGFGRYLTRDQIERLGATRVTDILMQVPGASVYPGPTGNTVVLRGNCRPAVFLDGVPVPGDQIDAMIPASMVGAVEVYTSAAFVPFELTSGGSSCGAIGIWTTR